MAVVAPLAERTPRPHGRPMVELVEGLAITRNNSTRIQIVALAVVQTLT